MSEVAQFPLDRRMSVEEHLRRAAIERRQRLYYPPNGRKSEETEVLSEPALRKRPPKVKVIHDYPHVDIGEERPYLPSCFAHVRILPKTVFPALNEKERITIKEVIRITSRVFRIDPAALLKKHRAARVVHPRHLAMYVAKEVTGRKFAEIGREFGRRDRTSVSHAWQKIGKLVLTDSEVAAQVEALQWELFSGHRPNGEQPVTG